MAPQIKLLPDQQYIQDGLRGGTITLQEVSIKAIDADVKYQARVTSIDMNHVRKLASIRDTTEQPLAPIVLFLKKGGRYQIGDGFHRLKEAMIRKDVSIRAYVVKVEDWEHDCRLFAAMCNQELCLPRTKEDVKKAVELLFEDPVCWQWSDIRISKHCGVTGVTIGKYRHEYSMRTKKPLPDRIITQEGHVRLRTTASLPDRIAATVRPGRLTRYTKQIKGKKFYLGTSEEKARTKLSEITEEADRRQSLNPIKIRSYLTYRLISNSLVGLGSGSRLVGTAAGDSIFVVTEFARPRQFKDADVFEAVGKLILLREHVKQQGLRLVVICYAEDGPSALIKLARGAGIEFLSPEEFADSIKAKKEGVA